MKRYISNRYHHDFSCETYKVAHGEDRNQTTQQTYNRLGVGMETLFADRNKNSQKNQQRVRRPKKGEGMPDQMNDNPTVNAWK